MKMLHQYHTLTTSVNSISFGSKSVYSIFNLSIDNRISKSLVDIRLIPSLNSKSDDGIYKINVDLSSASKSVDSTIDSCIDNINNIDSSCWKSKFILLDKKETLAIDWMDHSTVPDSILELGNCSCPKIKCATIRCSCHSNKLPYTDLCKYRDYENKSIKHDCITYDQEGNEFENEELPELQ